MLIKKPYSPPRLTVKAETPELKRFKEAVKLKTELGSESIIEANVSSPEDVMPIREKEVCDESF